MNFFDISTLGNLISENNDSTEETVIKTKAVVEEVEDEDEETRQAREEKEEEDLIDRLVQQALAKVKENERQRQPLITKTSANSNGIEESKKRMIEEDEEEEVRELEESGQRNQEQMQVEESLNSSVGSDQNKKDIHIRGQQESSTTAGDRDEIEAKSEGKSNSPTSIDISSEGVENDRPKAISARNQYYSGSQISSSSSSSKTLRSPSTYSKEDSSNSSISTFSPTLILDIDNDSTFKTFFWDITKQSLYYLQKGILCLKKMSNEVQYHERYIFLADNIEEFCWGKTEASRYTGPSKAISIYDIKLVSRPPQLYDPRKNADMLAKKSQSCCLHLELATPFKGSCGIDLVFDSDYEKENFCHCLGQTLHYLYQINDYENKGKDKKNGEAVANIYRKKERKNGLSSLVFGKNTNAKLRSRTMPLLKTAEENLAFLRDTSTYSLYGYIDTQITRGKNTSKLMEHRSSSITSPLTRVDPSRINNALNIFNFILEYSTSREEEEKFELIEAIINEVGGFKDLIWEVYIQLLKQCILNETSLVRESFHELKRIWELLLAISGEFIPDDEYFVSCLIMYCDRNRFRANAIGAYANNIYFRLRNGATSSLSTFADIACNYIPVSVFNVSLEDTLRKEYFIENCNDEGSMLISIEPLSFVAEGEVPKLLEALINRLRQIDGLKTEGIFRISSDINQLNKFKKLLSDGRYITNPRFLCEKDPHLLANLLKLWIRELAEPLIPFVCYEELLEQVEKFRSAEYLNIYSWMLKEIPSTNLQTIIYLVKFLMEIMEHQKVNKMTKENLFRIFAPIFIRQDKDLARLFGHSPEDEIIRLPLKQKFLDFVMAIISNCL